MRFLGSSSRSSRTRHVNSIYSRYALNVERLENRQLLNGSGADADRQDWSGCTVRGGDGNHYVDCGDAPPDGGDAPPDGGDGGGNGADEDVQHLPLPMPVDCKPRARNNWCDIGTIIGIGPFEPNDPTYRLPFGKDKNKHDKHDKHDKVDDRESKQGRDRLELPSFKKDKHNRGSSSDSGLAKNLDRIHRKLIDEVFLNDYPITSDPYAWPYEYNGPDGTTFDNNFDSWTPF